MAHTISQDHASQENKPKTALSAAFWFVLILGGLLIATFNFVRVMSAAGEGQGTHQTEHGSEAAH
jgi:lipid-A-disaccharide synthase-like uncharacterized protein